MEQNHRYRDSERAVQLGLTIAFGKKALSTHLSWDSAFECVRLQIQIQKRLKIFIKQSILKKETFFIPKKKKRVPHTASF